MTDRVRLSVIMNEPTRNDERRQAEERLEAALMEGLQGEATELDVVAWAVIRREAREELARRRQALMQ